MKKTFICRKSAYEPAKSFLDMTEQEKCMARKQQEFARYLERISATTSRQATSFSPRPLGFASAKPRQAS